MRSHWLKIALLNFLIAASIGALLRFAFVEEVGWLKFRNFMHAHSHVAMLGWLYLAFYSFLIGIFLRPEQQAARFYNRLFWVTQLSVIGMLFTFPFFGYQGPSGAVSFLHVVCSFLFVWRLWKDLDKVGEGHLFSVKLVKTALLFMMLSAVGIFSLMVFGMGHFRHSGLFYMSVQFFLHFQFNGWFLFALLGLFFKMMEDQGLKCPPGQLKAFFWLLVLAGFLTYALAVAWSEPHFGVFAVNSVGVLVQLAALVVLLRLLWPKRREIMAPFDGWVKALLLIALVSLAVKMLVQTAVALPFVATAAYTIRNYVIGFFHLILLGMTTSFLLGFGIRENVFSDRSLFAKLGLGCWVVGFLGSEALLFLQGTLLWAAMGFLPYYYEMLFGISVLIPVGVGLFLMGQLSTHTPPTPKTQIPPLP